MACLRLVYAARLLEAKLDGFIAVACLRPDLRNDAGSNLNQGDAVDAAVLPVEGGHPYLASYESLNSHFYGLIGLQVARFRV